MDTLLILVCVVLAAGWYRERQKLHRTREASAWLLNQPGERQSARNAPGRAQRAPGRLRRNPRPVARSERQVNARTRPVALPVDVEPVEPAGLDRERMIARFQRQVGLDRAAAETIVDAHLSRLVLRQ